MMDDYQAYLLRIVKSDDSWRILLRDVANGESQHFVSQKELMVHLLSLFNNLEEQDGFVSSSARPPLTKDS